MQAIIIQACNTKMLTAHMNACAVILAPCIDSNLNNMKNFFKIAQAIEKISDTTNPI